MTLHLRQATQAARPPAARIRPVADASGSEWPHGNRMLDAVSLTEDETVAMTPPCAPASCIPTVTAAVTVARGPR
jgi:hypothetical protein